MKVQNIGNVEAVENIWTFIINYKLFGVNGNECNFAQISHGIAKCSQGYLLLIPQMKLQNI